MNDVESPKLRLESELSAREWSCTCWYFSRLWNSKTIQQVELNNRVESIMMGNISNINNDGMNLSADKQSQIRRKLPKTLSWMTLRNTVVCLKKTHYLYYANKAKLPCTSFRSELLPGCLGRCLRIVSCSQMAAELYATQGVELVLERTGPITSKKWPVHVRDHWSSLWHYTNSLLLLLA